MSSGLKGLGLFINQDKTASRLNIQDRLNSGTQQSLADFGL